MMISVHLRHDHDDAKVEKCGGVEQTQVGSEEVRTKCRHYGGSHNLQR